jgi:hypothetical protein
MESHDEERLMFKNLEYGNSSGNYNIQLLPIAIQRMKLAGTFYFTIPGPKMIWQFGEMGYDYSINYPCGTSECRLDPKPIRWDYFEDGNRKNLYKVWQALMKLREYETFSTNNFSYSLGGYGKRLTLLDSTMNANIIGNFNVVSMNINPMFPNDGWWYDYFTGDSILVTDTQAEFSLEPGEFHIYTTAKLPTPEIGILLDVEEKGENNLPDSYNLYQNFPNPFNPMTTIRYSILSPDLVRIKVYDILGREVKTLVNELKQAGNYEVQFDASGLASGIYLYRIESGSFIQTRKMIVLK